ncbi:MAG: hypothetical protein KGP14_13860 [Betaproteobacteria bacterium]|nr:hypothetical protein [Betaproteobacteria bacterium]
MIIFDAFSQLITLLACALIFVRAEPVLNRCHFERTALLINIAFYMLTIGSLILGGSVLFGCIPSWPTAVLALGVAMLLLCERRVRVLFRTSRPKQREVA